MAFPFSDEYPNAKPYYLGDVGPLYADPTEDYLDENEIPMASYGTEKALISRDVPVVAQTVMVTRTTNPSSYQQGEVPTIEELADRILLSQQVSDIDNPTEISSVTGDNQGTLLLAYEAVSGGINKATIYEWDTDVGSGGSSPQVVASTGGSWVAIAGHAATSGSAGAHTLDSHDLESGVYKLTKTLNMYNAYLWSSNASGTVTGSLISDATGGGELELYNSSGTSKSRISAFRDGYVPEGFGVGTNVPSTRLHVKESTGGPVKLRLENLDGYADLVSDSSGLGFMVDGSNWSLFQHGTTKALGVGSTPTTGTMLHVYDGTTSAVKVRVENSEGYHDLVEDSDGLGIHDGTYYLCRAYQAGTTNNQPRFVVGGSGTGSYHIHVIGGSTVYPGIMVSRYSGSQEIGLLTGGSYQDLMVRGKNFRLYQADAYDIRLLTNSTDRGRIQSDGIVRIAGAESYPSANQNVNIAGRCEIGAGVSLVKSYGASAFQADDSMLASLVAQLGYWSVIGTSMVRFSAPLSLTEGTVVKSVTFYLYDSSSTTLTSYNFRFIRQYKTTGGIVNSILASASGIDTTAMTSLGSSFYEYTISPSSDHTVTAADMLTVNIDVTRDNGLCYIYGFTVTYGEVVY